MASKSTSWIPDVDPKSPVGLALTAQVQNKLRAFLGADYVDGSLAQYVVIMLAHKTGQQQMVDNLVEFLGQVDSKEVASWLFENLEELARPAPQPQQQPKQRQQAAPARAAAHPERVAPAAAPGGSAGGSEGGGSDADTVDVEPRELEAHRGPRRLQSTVVVSDHRRSERAARGRTRSPRRHESPPRRRRSHSPDGRQRSPPRWRSPLRVADRFDGPGPGRRDPFPYRTGSLAWRPGRSPPRRRRSSSPHRGRGHGHGDWQQPWSPLDGSRRGPPLGGPLSDAERPWEARHPDAGAFGRLQPWEGPPPRQQGGGLRSQHHFQHDSRWEEGREGRHDDMRHRRRPGSEEAPAAGAPYLGATPAQRQYDAALGQELLGAGQRRRGGGGSSGGQAAPPWERPSYMDLELSRHPQQAQQQQQYQVVPPPDQQQLAAPPALASPAAAAFARALAAAAGAGLGGGVAPPAESSGTASAPAQQATFQVTISQGAGGKQAQVVRRFLTTPLLRQPGLHGVVRQRLREMELQLATLRARQAEQALAGARQHQEQREQSVAARLDMTVRSVCIQGVHPAASDRVLIAHFGACGYIQRISHLREQASGRRTGVAYMQFATAAQAQAALGLDGSALLQRTIRVVPPDSPAARVAATRAARASFPPTGVVVPLPMLGGSFPAQAGAGRGGGRRGGDRGPRSFKYVRSAEEAALGGAAAGNDARDGAASAANGAANGGGDQLMAE